jgi:hypothetical protein
MSIVVECKQFKERKDKQFWLLDHKSVHKFLRLTTIKITCPFMN